MRLLSFLKKLRPISSLSLLPVHKSDDVAHVIGETQKNRSASNNCLNDKHSEAQLQYSLLRIN